MKSWRGCSLSFAGEIGWKRSWRGMRSGATRGSATSSGALLPKLSGISTLETDQRFSGREDFWIIVAARSEDETEIRAGKATGGRRDQGHSARDPPTLFS